MKPDCNTFILLGLKQGHSQENFFLPTQHRDKYNGQTLGICRPYLVNVRPELCLVRHNVLTMKGARLEPKGYGLLICLWLVQLIKTITWLLGDDTFLQPKGGDHG